MKTYNFYAPTLVTSASHKIVTKMRYSLLKIPAFDEEPTLRNTFLSGDSSIGDGGFGAFLRNCAQTEPSPILLSIKWQFYGTKQSRSDELDFAKKCSG